MGRCIITVSVLALTCIYIMSQMDTMLISKYIPFMESQEHVDEMDGYDEVLIKNHIQEVLATNTKDTYPPEDDEFDDDDIQEEQELKLLPSDIIYETNRWGDPLVIPS